MRKFFYFVFFLLSAFVGNAIEPILVLENKFKLNGEEEFYIAFEKGDKIIFDFTEEKGKTVKEVEIIELPTTSRFQDYKTLNISNKVINVSSRGLWMFRFKNATTRICNVKIQRIPADETKISFDTGWHYEYIKDTTYIPYTKDSLVGYDSIHYTEVVREYVDSHFEEYNLIDQSGEVRSEGIVLKDNPREVITFNVPIFENTDKYKEKQVISWAFWLATGSDANSYWIKNKKNIEKTLVGLSGITTPIGAFALGAVVDMIIPNSQQNVITYAVANKHNANMFRNGLPYVSFYEGSGAGVKIKFSGRNMPVGDLCLCLQNEKLHNRIQYKIMASAIIETKIYQDVTYERVKTVPKYVTLKKIRTKVQTKEIMVMNQK